MVRLLLLLIARRGRHLAGWPFDQSQEKHDFVGFIISLLWTITSFSGRFLRAAFGIKKASRQVADYTPKACARSFIELLFSSNTQKNIEDVRPRKIRV